MGNRKSLPVIGLLLIMAFTAGCDTPATTPTSVDTVAPLPPTSTHSDIATSKPAVTAESRLLPEKTFVIYDDHGSRDGMAALLYLLSHPEFSIEAVNISYGEAHPELYVQHTGRVLDQLGITDIPLGAGQDKPLAGGVPFPDWLRGLSDKFWDYPVPNADKTYPFQNAPEWQYSCIPASN